MFCVLYVLFIDVFYIAFSELSFTERHLPIILVLSILAFGGFICCAWLVRLFPLNFISTFTRGKNSAALISREFLSSFLY